MESTTRSIRFRGETYDALAKFAADQEVSVNWLVNRLCEEGIARIVDQLKVTS